MATLVTAAQLAVIQPNLLSMVLPEQWKPLRFGLGNLPKWKVYLQQNYLLRKFHDFPAAYMTCLK